MKTKLKCERKLFVSSIVFVILTFLCSTLGNAYIDSNNAQLQRLNIKIKTQEEINLGMQMKINELASLDNALEVANAYGLSYNNSNIRVISE